ncbi:MAG: hypothetical protein ACKESB_01090, partial [Candidatus Hodgkinia cicadicola]
GSKVVVSRVVSECRPQVQLYTERLLGWRGRTSEEFRLGLKLEAVGRTEEAFSLDIEASSELLSTLGALAVGPL